MIPTNENSRLQQSSTISKVSPSTKTEEPPKFVDQTIITKTSNQNPINTQSNNLPLTFEAKKSKLSPVNLKQKQPQENIEPKKIDLPKHDVQPDAPSVPSKETENLIPDEPENIDKEKKVVNVAKNPHKEQASQKKPKVKVAKTDLEMLMDEEFGPQQQDQEPEDEKPSSSEIKFSNFNLDVKQKEQQYKIGRAHV